MILAFDIGGSRIKAAVWDGVLRPLGEVATPLGDKAAFTAAVAGFVSGRRDGDRDFHRGGGRSGERTWEGGEHSGH